MGLSGRLYGVSLWMCLGVSVFLCDWMCVCVPLSVSWCVSVCVAVDVSACVCLCVCVFMYTVTDHSQVCFEKYQDETSPT